MNEQLLLVDLENIQSFDLVKAPPNARIKIFGGQTQSKLPTALVQHAQTVADLLKRSEKNKRPRKRATLHNYLATHFNKKLTGEEIKKAVEYLLEVGLIAGTETATRMIFRRAICQATANGKH